MNRVPRVQGECLFATLVNPRRKRRRLSVDSAVILAADFGVAAKGLPIWVIGYDPAGLKPDNMRVYYFDFCSAVDPGGISQTSRISPSLNHQTGRRGVGEDAGSPR